MENLPKIGDHVFVDRSVFGIKLYEHHGIYVGEKIWSCIITAWRAG